MMILRTLAALPLLALVVAGVLAPQTAHRASACSMVQLTLEQVTEGAQLVFVGEVIAERPIDLAPFSYDAYESTIHVVATLKGVVDDETTLAPLGFLGADCSGGPRLRMGERVLLFLEFYGSAWHVFDYEGGKYLLANGMAESAFGESHPTEEALQTVGEITGAPQDQLDTALAFARGELVLEPELEEELDIDLVPATEPQPDDQAQPIALDEDGGQRALLIALASLGLVAVTGALVALRLRTARN